MNQFLLEGTGSALTGSVAGPPSAIISSAASASGDSATGSAGGSGIIGFSSGSISSFMGRWTLFGKGIVHPLDQFADDVIDYEKIGAESENRRQHHAGGRAYLLPRRPGHQLHFVLQLFEIVLHPGRPRADSLRHAGCFTHS